MLLSLVLCGTCSSLWCLLCGSSCSSLSLTLSYFVVWLMGAQMFGAELAVRSSSWVTSLSSCSSGAGVSLLWILGVVVCGLDIFVFFVFIGGGVLWRWRHWAHLLAIFGAMRTCSCCSWRSSFLQAFLITLLYLVFRVRALPCGAFGAVLFALLLLVDFMMLIAIGGKFFSVAYSFARALWGMAICSLLGVVSWSTCSWLPM